ncbi:MAG TPA: ribosome biogenesis GTP-binding protein YihA/YsxC [Alphaproteobacteria bacterium]|nr:ribosome biogenesis GTP-binding protein YihA/YsxC [Alphaproteobacteria bacterium]
MGDHAPRGGAVLTTVGAASPTENAAALEAGRLLFAAECRFLYGVAKLDQLPEASLPEVAFVGRSNVGKSSLINALTGRKSLARTSQSPGHTRQLNFFSLADRLLLVDMPGYGYAKASRKDAASWQALARDYLRGRQTLRRLCLLIDARHGPKESDRDMMTLLDQAAVTFQIVLTKADKCGAAGLAAAREAALGEVAKHPAGHPEVLVTSALDARGIPELRAAIAALASPG